MALSAKRIKNRNAQFEQKQKCCQTKNTAAKEPKDVTSDDEKVHLGSPTMIWNCFTSIHFKKWGSKTPLKLNTAIKGKQIKEQQKDQGDGTRDLFCSSEKHGLTMRTAPINILY